MDETRALTTQMQGVENRLLVNRKAIVSNSTIFSLVFIALASLIAIVVTIVFYIRTRKNIDDTQYLHDELVRKEKLVTKQINAIQAHADRIASGDYSARLDPDDLKEL
jgi:hypothetical protein